MLHLSMHHDDTGVQKTCRLSDSVASVRFNLHVNGVNIINSLEKILYNFVRNVAGPLVEYWFVRIP